MEILQEVSEEEDFKQKCKEVPNNTECNGHNLVYFPSQQSNISQGRGEIHHSVHQCFLTSKLVDFSTN